MWKEKRRELTDRLVGSGYLKSEEVIEAFRRVPRHEFVTEGAEKGAYADHPLPIGEGQTISAPGMIAIMLEVLEAGNGDEVLEIGTGSGYNAALLAEIIGREGKLYTMERLEKIAEFGRKNLEKTGCDRVKVVVGDGTKGLEEEAPWDRILVTACAPEVPGPLVEQLKVGGKLVAPVGKDNLAQVLTEVSKVEVGETTTEKHGPCSFVPLIGEYAWPEGRTP